MSFETVATMLNRKQKYGYIADSSEFRPPLRPNGVERIPSG